MNILENIQNKQSQVGKLISQAKYEIDEIKLRDAVNFLEQAIVIQCEIDGLKSAKEFIDANI